MSVLILHGVANHRPPDHWEFQLAATLAAEGARVAYPSLPGADDPWPERWETEIVRHVAELPGKPVVICHSLAVDAWLALGPGIAGHVDRVLLVAPPGQEAIAEVAPRFGAPEPFAAPAGWEVWCSDADPYNAAGAAATHGEPFGLPVRIFEGAGHFTPDDGYGVWPEVVDWARGA